MPSLQNPREVRHFQIKVDNPGVFDPYHQRVTETCHSWHRAFFVLHQEQKELDLEARRCQSPTSKTNQSTKTSLRKIQTSFRRKGIRCQKGRSLLSVSDFKSTWTSIFSSALRFFRPSNLFWRKILDSARRHQDSQATDQKTSTFNHKYIKGLGLIED